MKLPIYIKSPAPNYKQFYLFFGVVLFGIGIVGQYFWSHLSLQFGLICMAALATFVVGFTKHFEPVMSVILDNETLQYCHRYGQWVINWSNISRIHIPVFTYALEQRDISYIGIKINELEQLTEHFSPRLASRIIHEHRDILALAVSQGDMTAAQVQINFSPFKFPSGYQVTGPLAACLYQMEMFEKVYGAHLFIPFSCFSESPTNIITQMNAVLNATRRRR